MIYSLIRPDSSLIPLVLQTDVVRVEIPIKGMSSPLLLLVENVCKTKSFQTETLISFNLQPLPSASSVSVLRSVS